jgi:hypothetical protein
VIPPHTRDACESEMFEYLRFLHEEFEAAVSNLLERDCPSLGTVATDALIGHVPMLVIARGFVCCEGASECQEFPISSG